MSRVKIGRNDPCPCGSGKKHKKCCLNKNLPQTYRVVHGGAPPEVIVKAVAQITAKQRAREEWTRRYGHVRPVIHSKNWGKKFIAIGNRITWSEKWKFIPDFLLDYVPHVFGKEWFGEQLKKQEADRHPVFQWRAACFQQKSNAAPGEKVGFVPDGLSLSYLSFAFSLFAVEDNRRLDDQLLGRLKHPEHFQGAFHEVFAEATCLRAGFQIEREDENDRNIRHTEFTAVHKATGERFAVEAKSKRYAGVMGQPGERKEKLKLHYGKLVNEAIEKNPKHPLVIFLDTNLPFASAHHVYGKEGTVGPSPYMRKLSLRIREQNEGKYPFPMLILTNTPIHYSGPREQPAPNHIHVMMTEDPMSARGRALQALYDAVPLYSNIPSEFPDF